MDAPDATIGVITGMVMALVLLDEWVFPMGARTDKDTRIEEAAAMMIHGFAHRPPAGAAVPLPATAGVGTQPSSAQR